MPGRKGAPGGKPVKPGGMGGIGTLGGKEKPGGMGGRAKPLPGAPPGGIIAGMFANMFCIPGGRGGISPVVGSIAAGFGTPRPLAGPAREAVPGAFITGALAAMPLPTARPTPVPGAPGWLRFTPRSVRSA